MLAHRNVYPYKFPSMDAAASKRRPASTITFVRRRRFRFHDMNYTLYNNNAVAKFNQKRICGPKRFLPICPITPTPPVSRGSQPSSLKPSDLEILLRLAPCIFNCKFNVKYTWTTEKNNTPGPKIQRNTLGLVIS